MAAGLGTRLRPLTMGVPKPLVPVANRPIMEHILELLARNGIGEVVANLHWFGGDDPRRASATARGSGSSSPTARRRSCSAPPAACATCATSSAPSRSCVLAADALTDIDLRALAATHARQRLDRDPARSSGSPTPASTASIVTGADGRVQGFQEKPDPAEALSDLANCMIYVLEPEIFDHFPDKDEVDFALDVFPALLDADVPFGVHVTDDYWNDVGSLPEYLQGNLDVLTGAVDVEPGGRASIDVRRRARRRGRGRGAGPARRGGRGRGRRPARRPARDRPGRVDRRRRAGARVGAAAGRRGSRRRAARRRRSPAARSAGGFVNRGGSRDLLLDCGKPANDLRDYSYRQPAIFTDASGRRDGRRAQTFGPTARHLAGVYGWAVIALGALVLIGLLGEDLGPALTTIASIVVLLAVIVVSVRYVRVQSGRRDLSERSFRAVTENSLEAIISADQAGLIIYLNPAAERMFGYPPPRPRAPGSRSLMPERFRAAHSAGIGASSRPASAA